MEGAARKLSHFVMTNEETKLFTTYIAGEGRHVMHLLQIPTLDQAYLTEQLFVRQAFTYKLNVTTTSEFGDVNKLWTAQLRLTFLKSIFFLTREQATVKIREENIQTG